MTQSLNVAIEVGPKGKKVVAVAREWPGLSRGAKTEELAIERLLSYVPRYAKVAELAGRSKELSQSPEIAVSERYPGTGSTDFWGISFAFSTFDREEMTERELERELGLMQACWTFFDDARARVSAELRKGPRGGGADRETLVRHVAVCERDWAKGFGVRSEGELDLSPEALREARAAYVDGIRVYHAQGLMAKKWPLRYLVRHTAFHTMDHAWQMEDGDLTGQAAEDASR